MFVVRRSLRGVSEPSDGETIDAFATRVRWQGFFLGILTMFGVVMLFTPRGKCIGPGCKK